MSQSRTSGNAAEGAAPIINAAGSDDEANKYKEDEDESDDYEYREDEDASDDESEDKAEDDYQDEAVEA
ncbi:hypothetical protein ACA910_022347 [Epithemia clementina (nom. ined.)]